MTKAKSREINYLTLEDFEGFVTELISMKSEFTEDIPPFETRFDGQLESILAQIQSVYFGKELYPGIVNKATWLFYCLIKDHPFMNGNKRVAILALFVFLKRNTHEIYLDEEVLISGLFKMAIRTAESRPEDIERTKNYLKRKIRSFILQY